MAKVLIWGLGLNKGGVGMVAYFAKRGHKVRITDLRTQEQLKPSLEQIKDLIKKYNIELILGEHRDEDFKWADIVVRNPAIPPRSRFIEIAKRHGAQVIMEMALFFKEFKGITVGITGTKGKSTTTKLVYEVVRSDPRIAAHHLPFLAGNIGESAVKYLTPKYNKPSSIAVLELSSYQLSVMKDFKQSPHIGVLTNIYPDHLNWHGSLTHYVNSKLQIFRNQTSKDYAIFSLSTQFLEKVLKAAKNSCKIGVVLSKKELSQLSSTLLQQLEDVVYWYKNSIYSLKKGAVVKNVKISPALRGVHNKQNILLAVAATVFTDLKASPSTVKKVLANFEGLYGRQQFVASINGVDFYNDTAGTHERSVYYAAQRFAKEYNYQTTVKKGAQKTRRQPLRPAVIFIMGGVDKGFDYTQLIEEIKDKVAGIVLFEGDASKKIKQAAQKMGIPTWGYYSTMKEAVHKAYKEARKLLQGKTASKSAARAAVVLSPGAASFNMFLNEWDRGKQFEEAVCSLKNI